MARPRLPLETSGEIHVTETKTGFRARTRYRDTDGVVRQLERTGTSKTAAKNALKAAMRDRIAPVGDIDLSTPVKTLTALWWDEWEAAKPRSAGTVRRYKSVRDNHLLAPIGNLTLGECDTPRLDRHVKGVTATAGYASARILVVLLTGIFDYAARHSGRSNPMASVAPVPTPEQERRQAYDRKQVATLRARLRHWDNGKDKRGMQRTTDLADVADFLLGTGCRPGEPFALDWTDIDLEAGTVTICKTMAKDLTGKWLVQPFTKTRDVKVLRLPKFTLSMLTRRRVDAKSEIVFPSSSGTRRIPDNFRVQWHAALKGTELDGRLPKEFRSTVATWIRDEQGIEAAQHQLGHSTVTTTERSYADPVKHGPDMSLLDSYIESAG